MDDNILLQGINLIKDYGQAQKTRALFGIDLVLHGREFASLIGPSGCGKSTLLSILGALDKPTEGSLFFNGRDLSLMGDNELAIFRNKNIGFIFQSHHLLPEFTALENVLIPSWIESGSADIKKKARAIELLETVGLGDRMNNPANNLSGGQQQRVSIARSLINEPDIVLADEPTGNLDSEATEQAYDLLREINKKMGTAFLIVTHDRHIAEKSDRVIEMLDGRIVDDYTTAFKDKDQLWNHLAPVNCKHCGREIVA
jgi:lipoprotein-releasing system ATP-binding protein